MVNNFPKGRPTINKDIEKWPETSMQEVYEQDTDLVKVPEKDCILPIYKVKCIGLKWADLNCLWKHF